MRTAILDGDTLLYAATSSTESSIEWEPGQWTITGNIDAAIAKLDESVRAIQAELNVDRTIFAISDKQRWRPGVMPEYKQNRKASRKPVHYAGLVAYAWEEYEVYQRPTLEGDDVLGILATHPTLVPGDKIMVAIDKDLLQIPGKLYNYQTGKKQKITEAEADLFFYTQTLTGDRVDGYPGCPGVGPVKAQKILDGLAPEEVWPAIVAAYEKAGKTEEDALANARVARICRHTDYDYKKKEVILWTP